MFYSEIAATTAMRMGSVGSKVASGRMGMGGSSICLRDGVCSGDLCTIRTGGIPSLVRGWHRCLGVVRPELIYGRLSGCRSCILGLLVGVVKPEWTLWCIISSSGMSPYESSDGDRRGMG